jgi:very-short-patch-repair endonuclease
MNNYEPAPEELKLMMQKCTSVLSASKQYNIPRKLLTKLLDKNNLKPNYFVNKNNKLQITSVKYEDMSPKEIAMKFNVKIDVVKYYKKNFTVKLYDNQEIIDKLTSYGYDLDNQGLVKQIKYDDGNLHNSILKQTENHILQSSKFTERIYRIFHNHEPNYIKNCIHCSSNLKFYTFKLGYGNSNNLLCKNCLAKHCGFGVSKVSQSLFDEIYEQMPKNKQKNIKYHKTTGEEIIKIQHSDVIKLKEHIDHLNKNKYHIDFLMDNKIIEFDGDYWHKEPKYELAKDAFLKNKGYKVLHVREQDYYLNKEKTIEKCLIFLKQ